jgi:hypothetical protein
LPKLAEELAKVSGSACKLRKSLQKLAEVLAKVSGNVSGSALKIGVS